MFEECFKNTNGVQMVTHLSDDIGHCLYLQGPLTHLGGKWRATSLLQYFDKFWTFFIFEWPKLFKGLSSMHEFYTLVYYQVLCQTNLVLCELFVEKEKIVFPYVFDFNGCESYFRDKGVVWALKGGPMRSQMPFSLRLGF